MVQVLDRKIVEKAVREYSDNLLKIAYTYTKNRSDAEDIVQDAFLSLMIEEKEFMSQEHMKAWLIRVTINKSKNHIKSAWVSKQTKMPEELEHLSEEENELLDAVFLLEEKYRIPIHLFYYEGYTITEIAEIMGKNPATIGSWLDRGRKRLKKQLGDELFER